MKNEYIVCNPEKCVGCEICEIICSAIKENGFNPVYSRIHTAHIPIYSSISSLSVACLHCEEPACVRVCPRHALTKDEKTGVVVVNTEFEGDPNGCNVPCAWCVVACEFGAILLHPGYKKIPAYTSTTVAVVCDLCPENRYDGDPPCVKFCPKGALSVSTLEKEAKQLNKMDSKKIFAQLTNSRKNSKTLFERIGRTPLSITEKSNKALRET